MSFFDHAFRKVFLAKPASSKVLLATGTTTQTLTAGQIGFYKASDWTPITAPPATVVPFYLVQGSYHTKDKLTPLFGGLQESVKSKMINPKYISKFYKNTARAAQNQILSLGWDLDISGGNESTFTFECGKSYQLYLSLQGSPALRTYNHNIEHVFEHYTGCCADDCNSACTGDPVDPACVMLAWKDMITQDPIWSQFLQPQVYIRSGSGPYTATEVFSEYDESVDSNNTAYTCETSTPEDVVAGLKLTVAYADTAFGNCSFSLNDHYELDPLLIFPSIRDNSGNPCSSVPHADSGDDTFLTEIQAPVVTSGVGDTVVREWALSESYRSEPLPDGASADYIRMRSAEDNVILDNVTRSALFDEYHILHNVPNNSSGLFSTEQYDEIVYVPTGTNMTQFTAFMSAILTAAGNGVTLETFS